MTKYCIIFIGEINDMFQLDAVKLNFKNHFKLSEIKTNYIFSGKEITLKKDLTQEKALEFVMLIDKIGGVSYIEPMPQMIQLPEGITEDRRVYNKRKINDRRNHVRAGLNADRRVHRERRSSVK
ncbi:MAG: hypothetical protein OQL19_19415 [Gammaproteobacteria bacterium]|nr:hypothetical protein [Gammaproteobacteria bacterium]